MLKNFRSFHLATELYQKCQAIHAAMHLKDQLLRASLSVALNLAEGSAKPTPKERRRFYSIALASLRETQALLMLMDRKEEQALADHLGASLYKLVQNAA